MAIANQVQALLNQVIGVNGQHGAGADGVLTQIIRQHLDVNRQHGAGADGTQTTLLNELRERIEEQSEYGNTGIPTFYRRDDEDPYQWIEIYEQACTTNGWAEGNNQDRKVERAAKYLKGIAFDWFIINRRIHNNIQRW